MFQNYIEKFFLGFNLPIVLKSEIYSFLGLILLK